MSGVWEKDPCDGKLGIVSVLSTISSNSFPLYLSRLLNSLRLLILTQLMSHVRNRSMQVGVCRVSGDSRKSLKKKCNIHILERRDMTMLTLQFHQLFIANRHHAKLHSSGSTLKLLFKLLFKNYWNRGCGPITYCWHYQNTLSHSLNNETHLLTYITTNNHTLIHKMTLALRNIISLLTFFAHTLTGFLQLTYSLTCFLHTHILLASCLSYFFLFTTADVEEETSITNQLDYS
jgi:hypothetical protein